MAGPSRRAWSTWLLPRDLHPGAWWIWALCLAVAASRTTNPWVLLMITAVACFVVVVRRSDAPWALAFRLYLVLAALIVVLRLVFRVIFGGGEGGTVVLSLPEIPLPVWAAGIRLLGDVTAESLLGGLYDGMRLATMIVCLGAANALANPKRLLTSLPPALYEVGTAVVVALSVFPQLAESVVRVRRARRLRGTPGRGVHALRTVVIPVLEDALDRSLRLAAAMDTRGYGRVGDLDPRRRAVTGALMVAGLVGICVGTYATLDTTTPRWLAAPGLALGVALAAGGMVSAGSRVRRTRYRPDRWLPPELVTVAAGLAVAVPIVVGLGWLGLDLDPAVLTPSSSDVAWPPLSYAVLAVVLLGALPAVLTPPPVLGATPDAFAVARSHRDDRDGAVT